MPDVHSLVLKSDSTQIRKSGKDLDSLSASAKKTESSTNKLAESNKKTSGSFNGLAKSVLAVSSAIGTGYLIKQYADYADTMTNVNSKLKLVTDSTDELIDTQQKLYDISQKTRSNFENNVDLYQKISFSTKELNLTQKEQLSLTEQINKELLISGTTAVGAATLITQLGQAFSNNFKGVAQELGTVRDQSSSLYQTLLAGTGKTGAEFKKMAETGKLSSKIIIDAILNQADKTDESFSKIATTIDKSLGNVGNSTTKMIGQFDDVLGISSAVSDSILSISSSLDEAGDNVPQIISITKEIGYLGASIATVVIATKSYNIATATARSLTLGYAGSVNLLNASLIATRVATLAIPYVAVAASAYTLYEIVSNTADAYERQNKAMETIKKNSQGFTGLGIMEDLRFEDITKNLIGAFDTMEAREKTYLATRGSQYEAYYKKVYDSAVENYNKIEKVAIETSDRIFGKEVDASDLETGGGDKNAFIPNPKEAKKALDDLNKMGFEIYKKFTKDKKKLDKEQVDARMALDATGYQIYLESVENGSTELFDKVGDIAKNNIASGIQSAFDGDLDLGGFTSQITKSVGQAMLMSGNPYAMAGGLGLMAIGSLLGQDSGGGESQAEKANKEFDTFISGLNKASQALEGFGNVGSSIELQIVSIQDQILKSEMRLKTADELKKTGSSGTRNLLSGDERNAVIFGFDKFRTQLTSEITKYTAELSNIVTENLASTLDISKLTTDQLKGLTSEIDVQSAEDMATELNNLALQAKISGSELEDNSRAIEIMTDANYIAFQNNAEAIELLTDAEEKRIDTLTKQEKERTKLMEESAKIQSDIARQISQEMLGSLSYLSDVEKLSYANNILTTSTSPEDRISSSRAIAEISRGTTRTREDYAPIFAEYLSEVQKQAEEATTQDIVDEIILLREAVEESTESATEDAIYGT
jgi:tape measure domain-containing protein